MSNHFLTTSSRIKSTPFTSRNEKAGVKKYTVYNRTLIPTIFRSLEEDYFHLKNDVQLWDVTCQQIIQIKGKEAINLVRYLFCRDLTQVFPGKAYYAPIVNFKGGLLNDPVIFCIKEDCFWVSIADSDLHNWISAINEMKEFKVQVTLPEVYTMAVQGPKSLELLTKIFNKQIQELKFFNFKKFDFNQDSIFISKTGFSKQSGFELLVTNSDTGISLWDLIMEQGKDLNIRVGCPNMIERVESNLLSYGNEMNDSDNPYECGLGKFCSLETDYDFIGKQALLKKRSIGFKKSIYRVEFDNISEEKEPFYSSLPVYFKNTEIGKATSIVWSPKYSKYIGFLISDRKIEKTINDHYIANAKRTSFIVSEIL